MVELCLYDLVAPNDHPSDIFIAYDLIEALGHGTTNGGLCPGPASVARARKGSK